MKRICFFQPEFQKRVLFLLTEIRTTIQRFGKNHEPPESDFHVRQVKNTDELQDLEESLKELQNRQMLVSCKLVMTDFMHVY